MHEANTRDSKGRRILRIATIVYLICGVIYLVTVEMRPYGVVSTMNIIAPGVPFRYRLLACAWALGTIALWPIFLTFDYKWR